MILAGDVGGTKTNLALYRKGAEGLEQVRMATYPSREYPGLEAILRDFLAQAPAKRILAEQHFQAARRHLAFLEGTAHRSAAQALVCCPDEAVFLRSVAKIRCAQVAGLVKVVVED